jgi:hypothetical protein
MFPQSPGGRVRSLGCLALARARGRACQWPKSQDYRPLVLLKITKRDRLIMVSAESFADDEEAKKSANQLATLFDAYGSDKSNIYNHH